VAGYPSLTASFNPDWDMRGQTIEDIDGYRVVVRNAG